MEPAKTDIPPKPSIRPPAKLTEKRQFPAAKLKEIQFGLLSNTATVQLSVIREKDESDDKRKVGITRWQDLFDPRLGVPNKDQKCGTCNGTRRGGCDRPNSCDGHFGHIALPQPIYHPHFVRKLVKILSSICLGCGRVLEKKKRKNVLDAAFHDKYEENGRGDISSKRPARKRKAGAAANDVGARKRRRTEKGQDSDLAKLLMHDLDHHGIVKQEVADSYPLDFSDLGLAQVRECKLEPTEVEDSTLPGYGTETPRAVPEPEMPKPSNDGQQVPRHSNDAQPVLCKYCGGPDGNGSKLPKIKLKLLGKVVGRRGRVDSIKLVVDEKAGVLPVDFWDFVNGHPTNFEDKTRTLLPKEALKILRKIPKDDIAKLHMDKLVSQPEDFILKHTLVSPNCNRLAMEDWSSTLQPKVLMRSGRQNTKLEALVRKAKQVKPSKIGVKDEFADVEQDCEDLQLVAARHYRACKVVEYKMVTGQEIEETGGSLELKWLKANVLAKRSNYSARTIINGDPCIMIEEIAIPKEIALRLTVEEKVNNLNIKKWQKHVNDYMSADNVSLPGAFILKKKNEAERRDLEFLRARMQGEDQRTFNLKVELGDTIARCLRDGDNVFANRPPSLHKHSLIALKAKVHSLSTFAINPLICPPFDADFDGDAFHIFVPQSLESVAELQELMSVPQQMICPQGGQPLIGLTQDTLVGGHLLTCGHVFISRTDMQQLSMWCSSKIPVPAIVKAPIGASPLWTGKQLFSMTLPDGLNFGNLSWTGQLTDGMAVPPRPSYGPEGEVLILTGEVLICQGGAKWLERSTNGIIRAVCDQVGPVATMEHLNFLQAVLHQWLLIRGFSVGLLDYHAGVDTGARKAMLDGVQKSLQVANEASLKQALRLDRQVQDRILSATRQGTSQCSVVEDHQGCFGLLLGDGKGSQRVTALQGAAIERFQALTPVVENLVTGYMDQRNSLLAMVRSGSKGSISKLTQQAGCLGLQLYKGERLLPLRSSNKLSYFQTLRSKSDIFYETKADSCLVGYWESRGIIKSSYLDGLNPLEFFIDSMASRCNVMRQGIEEPNQILKSLMLFTRDIHVAYDGTVRNQSGNSIIQFQYGGAKDFLDDDNPACKSSNSSHISRDPADHWADSKLAGEPVGVVAATSIAEPAYNVRMQSMHQAQVLGIGPVPLLKETLLARSQAKLKLNDRRCILRLPHGFGKERRALEVQGKLQKITLEMITLTSAIQFSKLDNRKYVIMKNGNDIEGFASKPFKRMSPWIGHLLLCKSTVEENRLNTHAIVERLKKTHSGKVTEDSHGIFFQYSIKCNSEVHPHSQGLCILFFPIISPESVSASTKEVHSEKMAVLLESMKTIMLPAVLNTTIKGSDDIERVRIIWEDSGSASRLPRENMVLSQPSIYQARRRDLGELVIEVVVKASKGAGKRGAAWLSVKEACIPVMDSIDWCRSSPYSIQEVYQSCGVEAARLNIIKRLSLATTNMGKPVLHEHLTLVADIMTHCGNVLGLGPAGYRDFCRYLSISTPFSEAAFQQPKKTFLDAAARGASESIDGVLPSSVWGSRIPLGTGIAIEIKSQVPKIVDQKWPVDPLQLWGQIRTSEVIGTKRRSSSNPDKAFRFKQHTKNATTFQDGEQTTASKCMLEREEYMRRAIASKDGMDGKQEGCKLGRVEERKRAPAVKDNRKAGCKRVPERVEEGKEISDEPVSKLHKRHVCAVPARIDIDSAILRVNDPRRVNWASPNCSDAALAEEGTGKMQDKNMDSSCKSSHHYPVEVSQTIAINCVDATTSVDGSEYSTSQRAADDTSLVSQGPRHCWSDGVKKIVRPAAVIQKFCSLFYTSGENDNSHEPELEEGPSDIHLERDEPKLISQPTRKVLHKNDRNMDSTPAINGSIGPTKSKATTQESEQLIIAEKKKLHNLLHTRYQVGERVQGDVEKMLLEKVLVYHPKQAEKIGCGVDYVKVDYHPEHPASKCFHIVRRDGSCSDFSYHKCLDSKLSQLCNSKQT